MATTKTAKAATMNMRRVGPRKVAEAIAARGPKFWRDVQAWMGKQNDQPTTRKSPRRVAQVEPRATH